MNPTYLILFSLIGILVSIYILYSKHFNKPLICPVNGNCDDVVRSKYGKTFGFDNTILGILYYLIILVFGIILLINGNIFKETIVYYFIVGASAASVLFSLYLIAVQAFVLKKWCYYCITSSISAVVIFLILVL